MSINFSVYTECVEEGRQNSLSRNSLFTNTGLVATTSLFRRNWYFSSLACWSPHCLRTFT